MIDMDEVTERVPSADMDVLTIAQCKQAKRACIVINCYASTFEQIIADRSAKIL